MASGNYDRTKKSLRNSIVAVSLQFVSILVGFFSRKIFLDYLGTEVLGLNTTAQSLLGFLNLAELGIGSAISVTLYKPLFDKDKSAIKEIVALQGWLYRRIAFVVIGASLVLMCFFPLIFSKTSLPLWYAFLSFGVMLFSSLLSYFVNYKQIVLSANQQEYKIQLTWKLVLILKLVAQALAVKFFPGNPFLWWVGLEFAFTIVSAIVLNLAIYRNAPYLKEPVRDTGSLRLKYPQVVTKVKQLFFHKIGNFVIAQTSPLIIYAFSSLTLVALYGNYLLITSNLGFLLASMFSGLSAGIGSVISSGDRSLLMKIYREIFSFRFYVVSVCSICILFLAQPFVSLWLGEEYLLDNSTLILLVTMFFCMNFKNISEYFINAYGLFSDIWSPVAEAVINLGCSILLGKFYGLNGIIAGIVISQVLIHMIWKPYFLFKKGLSSPLSLYFKLVIKHFAIFGVVVAGVFFLSRAVLVDPSASLWLFLIYAAVLMVVVSAVSGALLLLTDSGARSFVRRIKYMNAR